jgi:hypothetical protein
MASPVIAKTKFCGATITNIQANVGWQEEGGSVLVDLVEDPKTKDIFTPPTTGTPLSLQFGGFRFDGIVQKWTKGREVSRGTTYSVNLIGPAVILENVSVILDGYRGVNVVCPNLLNVFGYLEGGGNAFGGAQKNGSGIPWFLVKKGIEDIQLGKTAFSTGIQLKRHTYYLDTTSLPTAPDFYRMGAGIDAKLDQIISQLCNDAGYSYMTFLEIKGKTGPHRIYFKTRSRLSPQPLGQIDSFAEGKELTNFEAGAEFRNDVTSGVIFGGDLEEVVQQIDSGRGETIWPFWGFQESSFLIPFGTQGNAPVVQSSGFGNDHTALLNSSRISSLIGSSTYSCSIFEMRLALASFDSWAAFIVRTKPDLCSQLGVDEFPSVVTAEIIGNTLQSLFTGTPATTNIFSGMYDNSQTLQNLQAVYSFVSSYASEFLGRKFVVRIPFLIQSYFESETNNLTYNLDPTNEGYWPDYLGVLNNGPLGLNYFNFNKFSTPDGKLTPFVKFTGPNLQFADLSQITPDNCVIQDDGIYMACTIEDSIIYTPAPAVLVTLNEPLWFLSPDPLGGIDEIAFLLNTDPDQIRFILQNNGVGEFPIGLSPMPFWPQAASICLRSNAVSYGPWTSIGVPGKTEVRQDTELVPWNYGSFDTMNIAAQAQLASIGSTVQEEESGSIGEPGASILSLGDQLNGAGPIVTSVDIQISDNGGVVTNYRMLSITPVFGTFSRQYADRLRRVGRMAQDMRRTMRSIYTKLQNFNLLKQSVGIGLLNRQSRAVTQENVQAVLQAQAFIDPTTQNIIPMVASHSFPTALANVHSNNDQVFLNTASMGFEGLVRPFTTAIPSGSGVVASGAIPNYEKPVDSDDFSADVQTGTTLNPFQQGCDMQWASHGTNFQGMSLKDNGNVKWDNMRVMGLRGPLVMNGWGKDLAGFPVPNEDEGDGNSYFGLSNNYMDNYLSQSNKWKVGPIELMWDRRRKLWTAPGMILLGTLSDNLDATSLTSVDLILRDANDKIPVYNPWNVLLKKDLLVGAMYNPLKNQWEVVAANC